MDVARYPHGVIPQPGRLATVTTARSHDTTSVSTSIMHPPSGLLPQGAAAPTGTYSEALTFNQAPQTRMRGVNHLPLPGAGYPSVDPRQTASTPRRETPIRQEHPVVHKTNQGLLINSKYKLLSSPPTQPGFEEVPSWR